MLTILAFKISVEPKKFGDKAKSEWMRAMNVMSHQRRKGALSAWGRNISLTSFPQWVVSQSCALSGGCQKCDRKLDVFKRP